MLATILNDASLLFSDGQLMDLRPRKPCFVPVGDLAPGNPHVAARVVVFITCSAARLNSQPMR